MSSANLTWGSPRIVGGLAKLGIHVAKATVERYMFLDNVIVLGERHLRRLLGDYFQHYHRWRCHRSLAIDCPEPRPVQGPDRGVVVAEVAEAGGLLPALRAARGLSRSGNSTELNLASGVTTPG
jgi:hypothetical protein